MELFLGTGLVQIDELSGHWGQGEEDATNFGESNFKQVLLLHSKNEQNNAFYLKQQLRSKYLLKCPIQVKISLALL